MEKQGLAMSGVEGLTLSGAEGHKSGNDQ